MIKIPLPTANPGDCFKIGLKVSAPAMMYDINDFDAVGLLRYRHGPTRFRYMLRSERKFIGAQCFAVHRSGLRILRMPPGGPELVDGLHVVRPMIDSVAALRRRRALPLPQIALNSPHPRGGGQHGLTPLLGDEQMLEEGIFA